MDPLSALLLLATGYVTFSSALVWGVTALIKRTFFYDDAAKDRYLPWVAGAVSLVIGIIAWGYAGDFSFTALAPYLLGSIVVLLGSEGIHSKVKKATAK